MRFMNLFDENKDGVLQLEEYIKLVRYVVALASLEYEQEDTGAIDEVAKLREENSRLKRSIDLMHLHFERIQIKTDLQLLAST